MIVWVAEPASIFLIFLIMLLAPWGFAVVTRVAGSVWILGHHLFTVASSRPSFLHHCSGDLRTVDMTRLSV